MRCGFTEDDIRERFVQEEQWEELSDEVRREAIQSLMDAGEYDHAATLANEAITEAVARYLQTPCSKKRNDRKNVKTPEATPGTGGRGALP